MNRILRDSLSITCQVANVNWKSAYTHLCIPTRSSQASCKQRTQFRGHKKRNQQCACLCTVRLPWLVPVPSPGDDCSDANRVRINRCWAGLRVVSSATALGNCPKRWATALEQLWATSPTTIGSLPYGLGQPALRPGQPSPRLKHHNDSSVHARNA